MIAHKCLLSNNVRRDCTGAEIMNVSMSINYNRSDGTRLTRCIDTTYSQIDSLTSQNKFEADIRPQNEINSHQASVHALTLRSKIYIGKGQ